MRKDTYYFPHDYNARGDEKTVKLLLKMGPLGYGLYWLIVEKLYEGTGSIGKDYEVLALDMRVEQSQVKAVIEDYGLFYEKEGRIRSRSVDRRLSERKAKSEKARKSASYRRYDRDANAQRTLDSAQLERKGKERKGNERKGKERKDHNPDSVGDKSVDNSPSGPYQSLFCTYKDRGQDACDLRRSGKSRFCEHHAMKVRDKFLAKQEARESGFKTAAEILQGKR